jgi:hypothetical protein
VPSPVAELVGWLALPALVLITSSGVGLLVERLLRIRLPGVLVAPLGACTAIVLVMPGYAIGVGAWLGVLVLVAATAAGLWPVRRRLREEAARLMPRWAALTALVVFGLYMAPVVLSGGWAWTGYNFVNDTAFQFVLTDWVARHGIPYDEQLRSTTSETVRVYLLTRYPVGAHVHMATLGAILRAPVEVLYQPYIASFVALSSLGLVGLASRSGLSARWAAVAGFVAASASLTYHYALQGNVKEMAMLLSLVTAAAAGRELLTSERPQAMVVCVALPLAASLAVFGAGALPFAAALGAVLLVAAAWQARAQPLRRRLAPTAAIGLAVLIVAAVPSLTSVSESFRALRGSFQTANAEAQGETLAHLRRPLPLEQAGGVWLSGDYRNAVARPVLARGTDAGLVLVGALGLVGLAMTLRRREVAAAGLVAAGALTYLLVAPRTSPYADAKMLALISPAVVLCGMLGAAALARRWRAIGAGAAGILGVLVLASAAFAYHDVNLAPRDRIDSLVDLGDRYEGDDRLLLWNEYEEFAKYFMRRAVINQPTEAMTESHIVLKRDLGFFGGRTFELDDIDFAYLQRFPGIVTRIRPNESRPPANYRREYRDDFYEVWRRQPGPVVKQHVSLLDERAHTSVNEVDCAGLRDLAAAAPGGSRLVAAVQPERRTLLLPNAHDRPAGWPDSPERPGQMAVITPGHVSGSLSVSGGRYTAWLEGSLGRPVSVTIDGRRAGSAQGINTPGAWLRAGRVELAPGRHRVEVSRPGGGLAPGDGAHSTLGALALVADGNPRLLQVEPQEAGRLCGRPLDWVEVVEPSR